MDIRCDPDLAEEVMPDVPLWRSLDIADAWGIGTEARNPLRARHNVRTLVYQYTRCKAWISFDYDSVLVGAAMVDGTWGVPPIVLAYPFTLRDLDAALDELEERAALIKEVVSEAEGDPEEAFGDLVAQWDPPWWV